MGEFRTEFTTCSIVSRSLKHGMTTETFMVGDLASGECPHLNPLPEGEADAKRLVRGNVLDGCARTAFTTCSIVSRSLKHGIMTETFMGPQITQIYADYQRIS